MDKKDREQKKTLPKNKPFSKNPLTAILPLSLFQKSSQELDEKFSNDITHFRYYQNKILQQAKEFLASLEELSPTNINLVSLRAEAEQNSKDFSKKINENILIYDQTLISNVKSASNKYWLSLGLIQQKVKDELFFQYNVIKENQKELLQWHGYEPTPQHRSDYNPFSLRVNTLKKQHETLINYVNKSILTDPDRKEIIYSITNGLKELSFFIDIKDLQQLINSNPLNVFRADQKHKKLMRSSDEHNISRTCGNFSTQDGELNDLINQFEQSYLALFDKQKQFFRALTKFPQPPSSQTPFLENPLAFNKRINKALKELTSLASQKNINIAQLLSHNEKLMKHCEHNFVRINKSLFELCQKVYADYDQFSLESVEEGSSLAELQAIKSQFQLLLHYTERYLHPNFQQYTIAIKVIMLELNTVIESPQRQIAEQMQSSNSNRMKFSASSSSSSTTSVMSATPDESKLKL